MVQLDLIGSNFVSILTNGFIQTVASPALYLNKPNAFYLFPLIDFSREQKVILHLMMFILYTVFKKTLASP